MSDFGTTNASLAPPMNYSSLPVTRPGPDREQPRGTQPGRAELALLEPKPGKSLNLYAAVYNRSPDETIAILADWLRRTKNINAPGIVFPMRPNDYYERSMYSEGNYSTVLDLLLIGWNYNVESYEPTDLDLNPVYDDDVIVTSFGDAKPARFRGNHKEGTQKVVRFLIDNGAKLFIAPSTRYRVQFTFPQLYRLFNEEEIDTFVNQMNPPIHWKEFIVEASRHTVSGSIFDGDDPSEPIYPFIVYAMNRMNKSAWIAFLSRLSVYIPGFPENDEHSEYYAVLFKEPPVLKPHVKDFVLNIIYDGHLGKEAFEYVNKKIPRDSVTK